MKAGWDEGRSRGRTSGSEEEEARSREQPRPPAGLCLLTGASGFLGSHLAEHLVERGYRVRILVRKSSKLRWVRGLPVEVAYGDIRDKASLAGACVGVQNVFHFGALTTARAESEFFESNEGGTRNLAEALAERGEEGGFFVYCSSLAAGGPAIATESHPRPVRRESSPDLPITPYGRSKLGGERGVFAVAETSGRFRPVVLRPGAVYGPRDVAVLQFFLWIRRGVLPLVGPEGARISTVYVSDVVEAACAVAVRDVRGVYYLTDGAEHSWEEVGQLAAELMDVRPREVRVPLWVSNAVALAGETAGRVTGRAPIVTRWKVKEMRQTHWVCSADRAARDWGYAPRVDLPTGLEHTLAWYRESGWV